MSLTMVERIVLEFGVLGFLISRAAGRLSVLGECCDRSCEERKQVDLACNGFLFEL